MGIQINGQTDSISAIDGSFSIQDLAEVNVTGVATASNFKTGTSNVHSTGYNGTNINVTGIVTAASANFTGNVSVGGTLTYQDVTNIDSVGIITARAGVSVPDGQKIQLGTSNDLQIYHDGTNTVIENTTGNLYILDNDAVILGSASGTESYFKGVKDGAAELYFDNTKKFETTSTGVTITGTATATEGLVLDGQTGSGKGLRLDLAGSSDYVIQETTTDDVVQFGGTGSSNFFVHNISNGRIGIGTDNPDERLEVGNGTVSGALKVSGQSSSVTSDGFTVDWESSSNSTRFFSEPSSGGSSAIRFFTTSSGTRAERLRIDSGGRIITGNYSTALDTTAGAIIINGDTSGGRLAFRGSTTSAESGIAEMFGYWDTNKVAGIIFTGGSDTSNKDDGQIKFYTSASGPSVTERVRINQNGCLQVGDPSGTPGEVMQIKKSSGDTEVITYAAPGSKTIFNCTGSNRFALERGYNSVFEIQDPNGNGVRSDLRFDGNIILNKNLGDTNNSAVQLYRLIGPQNLSLGSGMAIVGGQTDTISTKAARIMTSNNNGTAWFGPYGTIHPGSYTAMFHMKVSNNSNTSTIIRIDVTGQGITDAGGYGAHRPRSLDLAPSHFDNSDRYQYIGLDFNFVNPVGSNVIEVRGLNFNNSRSADLYLDHILIVPRIPSHDG